MTTTYNYIDNTNQNQYKLRNSKIIASETLAICPQIPSAPETPETPETLETVSHLDSNLCALVGHKPAIGADNADEQINAAILSEFVHLIFNLHNRPQLPHACTPTTLSHTPHPD